jgi:hypothetical protein
MKNNSQFCTLFLVLCFLLAGVARLQAVVLDWNAVNWPSGDLTDSYNIEGVAGDVITITITGDTGDLASNVNDTTDLTGGQGGSQQSLFINVDFDSPGLNYIVVTVEFDWWAGAQNVTTTLFDVDRSSGSWRDRIAEIIGIDLNGNVVVPTITTSPDNSLSNGGTSNQFVRGSSSTDSDDNDGNVGISFGSTPIQSFSFKYSNDDTALENQWIGLYDISYTRAIPEYHPGLLVSASCLLLAGVSGWRRLRFLPGRA